MIIIINSYIGNMIYKGALFVILGLQYCLIY